MLHIVLFQPEIPPNTGNIIRLCANTGSHLHLIHPLGFSLDEKRLRRAGLDYREWADVKEHQGIDEFVSSTQPTSVYAFTTKASRSYSEARFQLGDALVFGPETRGLPDDYLARVTAQHKLRLPMLEHSRSMNLSNCVAVAVYEAWRQLGFRQGV
ncbi:MAG: tRNA (uridine(34)/cytosine(34)/5-carboxymethylaminomethyluridine(34)-2'-O)-methyltransferase TrmL [Pseudomonadota bacterium]